MRFLSYGLIKIHRKFTIAYLCDEASLKKVVQLIVHHTLSDLKKCIERSTCGVGDVQILSILFLVYGKPFEIMYKNTKYKYLLICKYSLFNLFTP